MLGVGVIGAGHFGAAHATAIAASGCARLVAACRTDVEGLDQFIRAHGGRGYLDHRDLLADREVEAVVIATPHHLHVGIALDALAAGKPVMLEKPMATDVAGCLRLIEAARAADRLLMPGHTARFLRPYQVAREILDEGALGEVRFVGARFIKLWMEANRQPWHLARATGGGMLRTAGIHALDRLLGYAGQPATAVSATASAFFHAQEADDLAVLTLRFGDAAVGQATSIGFSDGAMINADEIVCERGVLVADMLAGVRVGRANRWREAPGSSEPDPAAALVRQWRAFAAAVVDGARSPVTAADGLHVVACIEAAFDSARERREAPVAGAASQLRKDAFPAGGASTA